MKKIRAALTAAAVLLSPLTLGALPAHGADTNGPRSTAAAAPNRNGGGCRVSCTPLPPTKPPTAGFNQVTGTGRVAFATSGNKPHVFGRAKVSARVKAGAGATSATGQVTLNAAGSGNVRGTISCLTVHRNNSGGKKAVAAGKLHAKILGHQYYRIDVLDNHARRNGTPDYVKVRLFDTPVSCFGFRGGTKIAQGNFTVKLGQIKNGGSCSPFCTQPPVFTASTPPATARVGAAYTYTFTATGDPAPTFRVSSGALPAGLSLNTTSGVLSGTPTAAGTATFTIAAVNGVSPDAVTPSRTITVSRSDCSPGCGAAVITIKDFKYEVPDSVKPGSMVTVMNADSAPHTVTAKDGGGFDVEVPGGGTAILQAPDAPGEYGIICTFHPQMTGTLVVK